MEPFLLKLAAKAAAKAILRGGIIGTPVVRPDDSGADLIDGGIDLLF